LVYTIIFVTTVENTADDYVLVSWNKDFAEEKE
jgi:hypothetical protein